MDQPQIIVPGTATEFAVDPDGECWTVPAPASQPGSVQRTAAPARTTGFGDTRQPTEVGPHQPTDNWLG